MASCTSARTATAANAQWRAGEGHASTAIHGVEFWWLSLSLSILPCVAYGSQRGPVARHPFATFVSTSGCSGLPLRHHPGLYDINAPHPLHHHSDTTTGDALTRSLVSDQQKGALYGITHQRSRCEACPWPQRNGKAQSCGWLPHQPSSRNTLWLARVIAFTASH